MAVSTDDFHFVQDSEDEDTDTTRHTRRSTRNKKVDRISWIGNPVYTEEDNKFYHAVKVDNITYYLKDARRNPRRGVKVAKGEADQTTVVAKINRLWESKGGEIMCQFDSVWVDPEDTPGGRRPYHGSKELVAKDGVQQLIWTIQSLFPEVHKKSCKIIIETFEDFSKRKLFPDNVFYVHSEKLLEPKIELASPTVEDDDVEEQNTKTNTKKTSHRKEAEDPEPQVLLTPPKAFDLEMDSIATSSPSKRKNRRVISDDGDYVVIKNENSQPEDEARPLRRLKRMKDLDEEDVEMEPNLEDSPAVMSTPMKRKRIITDSDDENKVFFELEGNQPTRRSTRIPELQQRRQDKFRSIVAPESSPEHAGGDEGLEQNNIAQRVHTENNGDTNNESEKSGSDSDVIDTTPFSDHSTKHTELPHEEHQSAVSTKPRKHKRDLSWVELSEQGKLAMPATKPPLQFDTPKTEHSFRFKHSKKAKQINTSSFLTERGNTTTVVNLGDDEEGGSASGSEKKKQDKDRKQKHGTDNTKNSRKIKHSNGSSFIPQLMFNDNDVDNDIEQHLKQQRLLHEFSRHSSTTQDDTESGRGRWGRSSKHKPNPVEDEDSEPEKANDSEYEDDHFLVADDAPIETYEPSQDELDEDGGETSPREDEEYEDDYSDTAKNDQDGLFEHVFTNKQAFIVFLQYMISACADPDFIPMMVDSESTDSYFKPALRKIRDQIQSRKTSLVQSSAWDAAFKEDLETRPYLSSWTTQNINLEDCHACLRANHPASFKICLSGPRYNPNQYLTSNNLLDLPILTEENEQGDDDTYLLGRFCHSRTSLYHRLHFFHVHMFEKVKKKVQQQQTLAEELVQALLNNSSWVTEMMDRFSNLLLEADEFMNDTNEIM